MILKGKIYKVLRLKYESSAKMRSNFKALLQSKRSQLLQNALTGLKNAAYYREKVNLDKFEKFRVKFVYKYWKRYSSRRAECKRNGATLTNSFEFKLISRHLQMWRQELYLAQLLEFKVKPFLKQVIATNLLKTSFNCLKDYRAIRAHK